LNYDFKKGSKVIITLKTGKSIIGILSSSSTKLNLILLESFFSNDDEDVDQTISKSISINSNDLIQLSSFKPLNLLSINNNNSNNINKNYFKIDSQTNSTSSLTSSSSSTKLLQPWSSSTTTSTIDQSLQLSNSSTSWDQFETNDRLTGTKSNYHEDIYTTKLDRTALNFKSRELKAAQLEREILNVNLLLFLSHSNNSITHSRLLHLIISSSHQIIGNYIK
jgi:PAB1-binding protein PBP1